MKKYLILLAVCGLLCITPVFAAEENQPAQYGSESLEIVDVPVDESTYREEEPTPYVPVEREPGRGNIEDIYQYWEDNGYPEDVSYAIDIGGEVIDDVIYTWWEIGLVEASEARKQEILDLVSPTGLVAFFDCTYTHAQKAEAYEALLALNDENIQIIFVRNADYVVAAVPEAQEKEYAQLLIRDYGLGAVVSVVGSASVMEDLTQAVPGLGVDGAGALPDGSGSPQDIFPAPLPDSAPEPDRTFRPLWLAGGLAAGGILLLVRQTRRAAQTADGGTAVQTAGWRQTVEAVRTCEEAPRPEVYQSILNRLKDQ